MTAPDDWRTEARCASPAVDPRTMFPEHTAAIPAARAVCADCPVAGPCLAEALALEGRLPAAGRYGYRGGLGPEERARLARGTTPTVRVVVCRCGARFEAAAKGPVPTRCRGCYRADDRNRQRAARRERRAQESLAS